MTIGVIKKDCFYDRISLHRKRYIPAVEIKTIQQFQDFHVNIIIECFQALIDHRQKL